MVQDTQKKPAFDAHMKKYDPKAIPSQRIKHLNEGVILHKAKGKTNSVNT